MFVRILEGDAGWDLLSERADVCQCVCRFVVGAGDVVEFASVEVPGELLDEEALGGHVGILGVPMSGGLLDHQVRDSIAEDSFDAHCLDRKSVV